MLRGAIFDIDGTLLDSMSVWRALGENYLAARGIKAEEGLGDILYPMSLEEGAQYLKKRYCPGDGTEKIISDILKMTEDFYKKEVRLKPGVKEYLKFLKDGGVRIAAATSNNRYLAEKAFERLGISEFFEKIVTCSELSTSKSEPFIYSEAAKILGTNFAETAVFEDSPTGIKSAKSVGFFTVAAEDFSNADQKDELMKTADLYIIDFTDLKLKKLYERNDNL